MVCISPGVPTTFRFDSPILPGSVKIQEHERFEDVTPGQKNLFVVPLENLVAGKHSELEVCFADGAVPECASFDLVVHPGLGMQEVKVLRQPRPAEHYKHVAEQAEAEVQQCRAEVRQLRAERGGPDGLGGAIAAGLVSGQEGIAVKILSESVPAKEGNPLIKERVYSYRASERVAVEAYFRNPGAAPWLAAGAVLRGPKGEVLKPVLLLQPSPILRATPGDEIVRSRVVVEFLATKREAQRTYTLILWDAERQRTVTLGNVTFP